MTNEQQNGNPPIPQRVESERVVIRPTARADAPYLRQWWNNPNIIGPMGTADGMQYYDEADIENWFRRHVDGRAYATHFMICLRDAGETPIGEFWIACDDRPGCVTFSLAIGDTELWGKGYARETVLAYAGSVFEGNCCGAMRLDVPVKNERAMRLCESLGFEIEHTWANGRFKTMILTRDAYELNRHLATEEQRR